MSSSLTSKVKEVDEKLKVSERVSLLVKQIDERLAITPTVATLVTHGR